MSAFYLYYGFSSDLYPDNISFFIQRYETKISGLWFFYSIYAELYQLQQTDRRTDSSYQ